jgi:DNA-binding transcriptional LysR family regulator
MPRPNRLTLELMETLVELVNCQGDASLAGKRLEINQPSMSKRLKLLQQTERTGTKPLVLRRGKKWSLTTEGERCLPAIQQLLRLERSLAVDRDTRAALQPSISIACGQTAVVSILREPLNLFRKEFVSARVRISTPRGNVRIQGVANGTYDFALVTHSEPDIHRIAGRSLYVETLFDDPFVLVCGKNIRASYRQQFESLPKRILQPKDLVPFPLILPEPDAGLRRPLDQAFSDHDLFGKVDIILEVGGWAATLDYVRQGWGVGIVTQTAVTSEQGLLPPRRIDLPDAPPTAVRLIARRDGADGSPDLVAEAKRLADLIRQRN